MRVAILGAAESGIGAALLAKKLKYDVFVSDFGLIPERYKEELNNNNILFEEGGHTIERLIEFGLVIKSPGVPETAPILSSIKTKGTKVISEIEFGYLNYSGTLLAITGSNGKTTTSGLIYHILKTADYDVEIGGNYGISFCRILAKNSPDYMVLELSSFQLDNIHQFKPDIALLLNITPDHLDRYGYDIMQYANAKMRITENQDEANHLIYNGDDQLIVDLLEHSKNTKKPVKHKIVESSYLQGIHSNEDDSIFEISIKGKHNLFNGRCAVEAARILGVSEKLISKGLATFVNEPHRLEQVAIIDGVTFINDSKATNVDATFYALDAIKGNIIWIAGGTDKGNDYDVLQGIAKDRISALICLGVENRKLVQSFAQNIPCIIESTKVSNVASNAMDLAQAGDTVILSPACASFDLFENYIDRGDQFKCAVKSLIDKAIGETQSNVKT